MTVETGETTQTYWREKRKVRNVIQGENVTLPRDSHKLTEVISILARLLSGKTDETSSSAENKSSSPNCTGGREEKRKLE